jgi:hypothetical protein
LQPTKNAQKLRRSGTQKYAPIIIVVGVAMSKVSKTTLALFVLAITCYMLSFTGIAIGLTVFGFFFEVSTYISMFSDYKKRKESRNK